jgi:hypothetical protein
MSREVHVRIWERLGVKFPRATRQEQTKPPEPWTSDMVGKQKFPSALLTSVHG